MDDEHGVWEVKVRLNRSFKRMSSIDFVYKGIQSGVDAWAEKTMQSGVWVGDTLLHPRNIDYIKVSPRRQQ